MHNKSGNIIGAIEGYHAASKLYMADEKMTSALSNVRHAAELHCNVRDYTRAAELYAEIGRQELLLNLTKLQAHQSFFLSGLLLLAHGCRDFSTVKARLKAFSESDDLFAESPQHAFLRNMIMVIESGDTDQFSFHVYAICSVLEMDASTIEIIEAIYKRVFIHH